MLKLLVILFASFVMVSATLGTASTLKYKGNTKHADLPNHCYYEEQNLSIPVNEALYPTNLDSCFKVSCRPDFVLEIRTCPLVNPDRECEYTQYDYVKPYPECCPIATCDGIVSKANDE